MSLRQKPSISNFTLCTSQLKPWACDPRGRSGNVTIVQCYILNLSPTLGGNLNVTIPIAMASVFHSLENKQLLDEVDRDSDKYQGQSLCYLPKPRAEADITN